MTSRNLARAAALLLLLAAPEMGAIPRLTAPTLELKGKVLTATGDPAPGVRIKIIELKRQTTSGDDGMFRFDNVPPGSYLLEATSARFGQALQRVVAEPGSPSPTITLDIGFHQEEVTVTGAPVARAAGEIPLPVDVLAREDLEIRLQPTLGETLNTQPGVNSTFFGQGASRPVIRGLGGDRVRMLEGGIGVGDVSETSPDHAVTVNMLTTEQVEIVRGPATLMYGSSAIGGAVNALDGRIATYLPDEVVSGIADFGLGSVSDSWRGALSLDGKLGRFVLHGDVSKLDAGDYSIPGFARTPAGPDDPEGFVPNSAVESDGAAGALTYVGGAGYLGVSYSGWNSLYGNPAEEDVRIDMKQRRWNVAGEITTPFLFLRGAKIRFGDNDYRHFELEGNEIGTRFNDTGWEGRLELPHQPLGPFVGAFGAQLRHRDLEAIGEERFIPPTTTDSQGVFLFEEAPLGPAVRLQLGARWEHASVDSPESPLVQSRVFDGWSGSVGFVVLPAAGWSIGVAGAYTTKLPSAQELFADGPHIGTNAFEIGDPLLQNEIATGVDVSVRRTAGPVSGSLSFFYNSFDGFIFERFTGEVEDDLPVIRYTQADSEFLGGEGHLDIEFLHADPHHLALELGADYVWAELKPTGEPLPRIPPLRYSAGVRYKSPHWTGLVEVRRVDAQDRVAPLETVTPGYTMLNAAVGYRLFLGRMILDLLLRGTNLNDAEARNNVSFLKDVAPLPGRDVSFGIRAAF
jgi:iron complex outermembrane receptor protein